MAPTGQRTDLLAAASTFLTGHLPDLAASTTDLDSRIPAGDSAALGKLATEPDVAGVVRIVNLTERVLGGHGEITPVPRTGQVRYYEDEIHTADGTLIGTTSGRLEVVHERPGDGHGFAVRTEEVHLFGTLFHFSGLNDLTAEFAGAYVSVPGFAVAGELAGWSAIRSIHMTPTPFVSTVQLVLAR
ncbi:Allene oxide cyclase barrel-like domain-containing protein [Frankia sp. AiPs1]|uniref:allene oxide cyclase barrel-like domain-containing protein n=1 Tax=Frankia sp. AiPa1 TaxID=573492 RepID=UPI00202B5336|nr:hypothetical protein [Frankia sp. AiPa1]MCL9760184.1 hypothetical protein [Frankia sp. AiPa1]